MKFRQLLTCKTIIYLVVIFFIIFKKLMPTCWRALFRFQRLSSGWLSTSKGMFAIWRSISLFIILCNLKNIFIFYAYVNWESLVGKMSHWHSAKFMGNSAILFQKIAILIGRYSFLRLIIFIFTFENHLFRIKSFFFCIFFSCMVTISY